ncbi:MAG: diacylglycerol kinase family lipid kinase, partial [Sphaerochaetaceae bacterium]|nr:diacylglycerol kinase family lipid kinase [Sphaerochaetaceae bacterium]
IYNPVAGKGRAAELIGKITDAIREKGYEPVVYSTVGGQEDYDFLKAANLDSYDLIICSGGDGTLNGIAGFICRTGCKTPFGYIPAGSTNDFAHSLGLNHDIMGALDEILSSKKCVSIDTGLLEDSPFFYVAAFGAITRITYTTPQKEKKRFGYFAYVYRAVKELFPINEYSLKVEAGQHSFEGKVAAAIISNSHYVGGFKIIQNEKANLSDGLFEVLFIKKPKNIFSTISVAFALASHKLNRKHMIAFQTDRITVTGTDENREIDWNLDGEYGGTYKKATVRVCPGSLNMRMR